MNNEPEQIFLLNSSVNQLGNPSSSDPHKVIELPEPAQVNLENVEDFSQVCRMCATITEYLIPIFDDEGSQYSLVDKIHKHLPIQVSEQDVLPRALCYQCTHTLLAWHELVACCEQADAALRTRLRQLADKEQESKFKKTEEDRNLDDKDQNEQFLNKKPQIEVKIEQDKPLTERSKVILVKPSTITLGENGKKYVTCEICKKHIVISSWSRHARTHCGEKRYSCDACGFGFSDSGNLARHARALHARQRPHACHICQKAFSRNSHLQDHLKSHSESRDFVCDLCGKASKSGAALRMHRKTHESECKFQCMECGARFKRRGELRAHVSVHTGERAHRCGCGRAFRLRSQLSAHSRVHDKVPKEFEEIADFVVPSIDLPQYPDTSLDTVPPASPAPLRTCDYCATEHVESAYREHLISAHSDFLFHCDECDTYVHRRDFILHMSLHAVQYEAGEKKEPDKKATVFRKTKEEKDENENTDRDSRVCQVDETTTGTENFETEAEIAPETPTVPSETRNEFSDHSDTEDGFGPLPKSVFEAIEDSQDSQPAENEASPLPEITECNETSNHEPVLDPPPPPPPPPDTNTEQKHDKKSRVCPVCSKVYTASSSYFYHMKHAHRDSGPDHECEVCGQKFGTRGSLKQHASIHTGEYLFACKQCGKLFRAKASLYIHEQTHNGIKKYACSKCSLAFRWRTHLKRHLKRHEAERAHVCETCGRGFSVHWDMLRHARTHEAGHFTCDKCGSTFAQLRYLKSHMDRKHSTPMATAGSQTEQGTS